MYDGIFTYIFVVDVYGKISYGKPSRWKPMDDIRDTTWWIRVKSLYFTEVTHVSAVFDCFIGPWNTTELCAKKRLCF